jgi:hypothetical protein
MLQLGNALQTLSDAHEQFGELVQQNDPHQLLAKIGELSHGDFRRIVLALVVAEQRRLERANAEP